MMDKVLITHQTGPEGKIVKRLYIEEASDIEKEFYLSCLVDRETSKIAFISSTEGGMDIEKVAKDSPNKIITNNILFPYFEKMVSLKIFLSLKSMYPIWPNSIFFSILPIGLIIAEIPLFADLNKYFPLSIALNMLCVKCC